MIVLGVLLVAGSLGLLTPLAAFAESEEPEGVALEITGDGVTNPVTLTLTELENMEQYQHVYRRSTLTPPRNGIRQKGSG